MMDDSGVSPVIQTGDLISIFVESSGYLAIPALTEPLPETSDNVTGVRAISVPGGSKKIPGDYNTR
jgi:hypothetical protein